MTREELSNALRRLRPRHGDVVYLERRGSSYDAVSGALVLSTSRSAALPEAWIFYAGRWPADDDETWPAFFEDLLAEMESMTGGADRCRWPLDEPWPRRH